jgi:ABC-type branched-subunit amino acid transport system ATPase component
MTILRVDGLGKRFGGLSAVDNVTFSVDEGEIVALVGPNGAGKSTLLKMIGGMHTPSRGTVTVGDTPVGGLKPHRSRRHGVAMVLQTPRPFETMTVEENVMLGALFGGESMAEAEARRRAAAMLEFVGLGDRAGDEVGALNLHEQRFCEIARQLAGRPTLILLDEVMAGLNDTELEHSVDLVRRARADFGLTVLWVEHVMKAVMNLAERVLVLNFGQLIADGEPTEVMRQPDVVAAYLGDRGITA